MITPIDWVASCAVVGLWLRWRRNRKATMDKALAVRRAKIVDVEA